MFSHDTAEQQEAQQDYENFEPSYQQQTKDTPQTLTPEQQQQLKAAYRRQDLQRVLDILHSLETGTILSTASDSITDKAILQKHCAALRERIAALEADIQRLQADETYLCMQTITSKDDYFAELEQGLQAELAALITR
ncbi:MAG: hypothetical protein NTW85_13620 [Methylococcales bacterium]|nr:hypothetical protein [Methylococcales bacterium]